ncbi:MAG: kelch repeat-containing protein [Candidatus Pelagadaptatus aseana]|uniref:Kelch repeat-containing protein n=1 Tax=Candidatus Pelagadaptatus aseana TaxID=3120508 RepID=UPI0039B28E6A
MDRRHYLKTLATMAALPWLPWAAPVGSTPAKSPGVYRQGEPLPQVLQEIYPALFKHHLVIAGGFSGFGPLPFPVAASHWFDLAGNQWRTGPELPHRLHHPYLVAHQDQLWALGGYRFSYLKPWQMQSASYVLNGFDDHWQAAVPLPGRRAEFAAGSTKAGLIVTAGRKPRDAGSDGANGRYEDHTNAADTWLWDGERWQTGAPIPLARNSVGTAVVDDRLHVIGGRRVTAGATQQNCTDHHVYDPQSDRWDSRAPLPLAQAGCAAAALDGSIYLFGGEVFTEPKRVFANAWRYDTQQDRWQALEDLPLPVHGHGAVAAVDAIHLLGGGEEVSAGQTSDQHTLFIPGD